MKIKNNGNMVVSDNKVEPGNVVNHASVNVNANSNANPKPKAHVQVNANVNNNNNNPLQ